jgi:uncharacterized protein with beta-barrel porin domain
MYRYLLATTAVIALTAPAAAETISTAVTQPVRTSTVNDGQPDSITISSTGSVKPASGTAVTMDSDHAVTNQGTIAVSNSDGAIGILAEAGTSGDIVNSGTITIDEPYTPTDTNNDGDLDGPFALGSDRFGIRTAGAHTGKVTNSGTITIEGNDSAGIWLGGPLTGAFTHDGTTTVTGDRTVGVRADAITGNVRLAGTVTARGEDAIGARFTGNVDGAMVVQGAIAATGYRATTAPSNTANLDADDLLQGGSALMIEGNVTGGIVLAVAPKDSNASDNDEDDDGIEDAKEGNAAVTSYGAAPAMIIGATDHAVAIGPVAGTASQFGLIVDGSVTGLGVYAGVNANGLVIGGRGGAVTIANGIGIAGTVSATANGASATGLRIGDDASVPVIQVSGTVGAAGGNSATTKAIAIQIDAGADAPIVRNSGVIKAVTGGTSGSATAIVDLSGGLGLIENAGTISATGAATDSTRNIAIDLTANTAGATVKQTQVAANLTAPSIVGDVRFGSGNDLFDVADGTVKGNVYFGAGTGTMNLSGDAIQTGKVTFGAGADVFSLAGSSRFEGTVDFGGGADTLTLAGSAVFTGDLLNAGSAAVNVNGGGLSIAKPVSIGSLSVGADGVLLATLDKTAGEGSLYTVAGTASFADGATLALKLADVQSAEGHYVVLQAGSITGLDDLETSVDFIPFMFKAELDEDAAPNTIAVDVAKKTTQELGLNRSESAAYPAVFAAMSEDEDVEGSFLSITNGDLFRASVAQMLPDHAGGTFEGVSLGTRTFARRIADPRSPVYSVGGLDIIVDAAGWSSSKDVGETAAYDLGGFGFSAAGEVDTKVGAFGASLSWFWNEHDNGVNDFRNVQSDNYELAAYWHGQWGGFSAFGRGSIGMANFNARRTFVGMNGAEGVEKTSNADWNGTFLSFNGGASYEGRGGDFFFRPAVTVDYLTLDEDGYTETGGGEALDLVVGDRKSDEFAVSGGLTVGLDFIGRGRSDRRWFRVETEGGWREVVGGSLGSTTAHFEGGQSFTLLPEQNSSGWFARLRALGGSEMFQIGGEVGAEDRHDNTALSLRGTVTMAF